MTRSARVVALAWGFWVVMLGGLLVFALQWVLDVRESASRQIEAVEPRFARLLGLSALKGRLEERTAEVAKDIGRHAYPASRDASQSGNDAQQRVRDTFSVAGLELTSIQVMSPRASRQFDRIPILLRVEGDLAALQACLTALPGSSPTLFVESFSAQAAGVKEAGPARVVAEISLFVLRSRP